MAKKTEAYEKASDENYKKWGKMQILKRKIKTEEESSEEIMHGSLIDGNRLSLRWVNSKNPNKDLVINFTREETEKIKKILK